jgi:thioredoxin reductase (NADPH)
VSSTVFDITIIGGGPIGLYAAAMAGEAGAACNLIESRFHLGGVMMAAYPDKNVYNLPGITNPIKGRDFINDLLARGTANGMVSHIGEYVDSIIPGSKETVIVKSNNGEYLSSTVIVAAGLKAYYSPFADMIRIQNWSGAGIYDDWPNAPILKNKNIAIVLGVNEELRIPSYVNQEARQVSVIFDPKWLNPNGVKSIVNVKADTEIFKFPWYIKEIRGVENPQSLAMVNEKTKGERELKIDIIVGFYDNQARQTVYSNMGIEMVGQQIKVDQKMQTSLKRVFAVGDIAWYHGKVMLLSAGIHEANTAVKNALKLI